MGKHNTINISRRAVILMVLISACVNLPKNVENQENYQGFSVTDFRGKELYFDQPAGKVVCLIESALSGIYMLNCQSSVIAVPGDVYRENLFFYYSQLDERIRNKVLPSPGNWEFVSLEKVVGLEPDLVIIWSSQTETIYNLEKFGIPVYGVMIHCFEDVFKEITDFGKIFGCSKRADSLIAYTRSNLLKSEKSEINATRENAYFMWAQGINETSGRNSTVNELLEYAGITNVCDLDQEHVTVSIEKLIDWDPGLIVMWYNDRLDPEDVLENPLLQGIDAVKNRRVFEFPEVFSCDFWTLKLQHPVRLVTMWAYSENNTIIDRDMELKDMYKFLYGKELHQIE